MARASWVAQQSFNAADAFSAPDASLEQGALRVGVPFPRGEAAPGATARRKLDTPPTATILPSAVIATSWVESVLVSAAEAIRTGRAETASTLANTNMIRLNLTPSSTRLTSPPGASAPTAHGYSE